MLNLFCNLKKKEAKTYSLVLCSAAIFHKMLREDSGWNLMVREIDRNRAFEAIEKYLAENVKFGAEKSAPAPKRDDKTFAGLWASAIILLFHIASDGKPDAQAYGSSARHILDGEFFRVVTSLFLHKDIAHLVGNMAALAFLGSWVCMFAGYGAGLFMILLSGAAGNAANAFLYQTGHISIGASTAIFGALGILVSQPFFVNIKSKDRKMRAWLPIASGFALLGFMGAGGKQTDILAHLFGFLAGTAIGLFFVAFIKRAPGSAWQILSLLIASVSVIISWMMASG